MGSNPCLFVEVLVKSLILSRAQIPSCKMRVIIHLLSVLSIAIVNSPKQSFFILGIGSI